MNLVSYTYKDRDGDIVIVVLRVLFVTVYKAWRPNPGVIFNWFRDSCGDRYWDASKAGAQQ